MNPHLQSFFMLLCVIAIMWSLIEIYIRWRNGPRGGYSAGGIVLSEAVDKRRYFAVQRGAKIVFARSRGWRLWEPKVHKWLITRIDYHDYDGSLDTYVCTDGATTRIIAEFERRSFGGTLEGPPMRIRPFIAEKLLSGDMATRYRSVRTFKPAYVRPKGESHAETPS